MSTTQYLRTVDGGTISVEAGSNPTPDVFGTSRRVRVELNFTTFENSDESDVDGAITAVGDLARSQVQRLLGTTSVSAPAPAAAAAAADAPRPRGRPPKVAETPPAPAGDAKDGFDAPNAPETPASPPEPAPAAAGETQSGSGGDAPTSGDEWGSGPVEEIADKALTDAASKHAERLAAAGDANGTVRIRKLIGLYNPDPTKAFSLTQLPQAQRGDFLTKIAGLVAGQE